MVYLAIKWVDLSMAMLNDQMVIDIVYMIIYVYYSLFLGIYIYISGWWFGT